MSIRKFPEVEKRSPKKIELTFGKTSGLLNKKSIKLLSSFYNYVKEQSEIRHNDLFPKPFSRQIEAELLTPKNRKKRLGGTFLKIKKNQKIPVDVTFSVLNKNSFTLVINFNYAEEANKSDSENYHLFNSISNPVVITNPSFKIIYCNQAFIELFETSSEGLYGKKIEQVYSVKSDAISRNELRKLLKKNGFWNGSVVIRHKSFGEKHVELSLKSLKDSNDVTTAFVGSFFDLTQEVKEKKNLLNREERFRVLYENNPLMIFVINHKGEILSANTRVVETLNYTIEELVGEPIIKVFNLEEPKKFSNYIKQCLGNKNKMTSREVRMTRKDGSSIWTHKYSCAFTDSRGDDEILIVCDDISAKKVKENELRLSEEKFFNAFYISPDSININRISDGLYIDINQGFMAMTGYTKEDVLGKTSEEINILANPADRTRISSLLKESGEVKDLEVVFRMKDGSAKIGLMSAKIININNEPCILSITHDITERKKAQQVIIENEIKYKALFDHANDAIFIMKDGVFIDCNTKTLEIFRCTRGDIIGQSPFKFSPAFQPDGRLSDAKGIYFIQKAQNGIPQFFEWRHIHLDGESFDAEVSLNRVEFGNEIYLQAIVRDVSDRKNAESKISLLAHALKSISESVSITDMSDNVIFLNDAFIKTYGYTLEELRGKPLTRIRSVNNPPEKTADILNQTIRGGWRGELLNVKKNGTEFYVHVSTSVIRDDSGKEIALIGVSTDITNRKKEQAELITAKQNAEEMSRLKSSFLANMSHELRTPLVGILGFAEMMQDEEDASEKKMMADIIHNSGRRLLETLNSLLDLARVEANRMELEYKKFDLVKVVSNCVRLFEGLAYTKKLTLKSVFKTNPIEVYLDESILVQILNNLVNNGIKYTSQGGVTVEVDVIESEGEKSCRIRVTDSGIGIPEKSRDLIFEEFRQVSEGFNRQFEGTGLGLTLTKKFVQMMMGRIYLESKVNEGSTFTVEFPINFPKAENKLYPDAVNSDIKIHKSTVPTSNHKPKILLVENDAISIEVTKHFLRDSYEFHSCEDGITAIQLTNKNVYDLILMDINLGKDMSGIETVQLIRNLPAYKQIPIVALTAFAMEGDKNEFISAGCSHYLSKPFTKNSIVSLLAEILNPS